MKCSRLFCIFFAVLYLCVSLSFTASAVLDGTSSVYDLEDVVTNETVQPPIIIPNVYENTSESGYASDEFDFYSYEEVVGTADNPLAELLDSGEPLPVVVLEPEASYSVRAGSSNQPLLVIGDEPPSSPLFYGSGWITGTDPNLGTVTLYFPANYKTGYWGTDRNGYLYNISSSSLSGYLEGVYNNSISASAFSYPRYRLGSSSSYNYENLYLIPENSNMEIAVANTPKYDIRAYEPYILLFIGGVLVLCYMKRS